MSTAITPAPVDYRDQLRAAIAAACKRIAPLWPLKNFVAVNPFLGFTDQTFHATCTRMRRVARIDILMPRSFYRQALADGVIEDRDLAAALAAAPRAFCASGRGSTPSRRQSPSMTPRAAGIIAKVGEDSTAVRPSVCA